MISAKSSSNISHWCFPFYTATNVINTCWEDLAQETFLIAWRELKGLREPEKVKSWLCGIARNVINNSNRKRQRQPLQQADPIDVLPDLPNNELGTEDRVILQEEEAILWRSLERIPENYREPLILFYREGHSIERVAQQLDLSQEVVKQRLSRGRKMLADEVNAFVEGTLRRSAPGRAFTMGVIASLPVFATSASATTIGAGAAKGSAVASSTTLVSLFSALLGPLIGFLGAYIGVKASLNATRTTRERAFVVQQVKKMVAVTLLFNLVLFGFIFGAIRWWKVYPTLFAVLSILIPLVFTAYIFINAVRWNRTFNKIRNEEQKANPELYEPELLNPNGGKEYKSPYTLLGLPFVHICNGVMENGKAKPAKGWIAIGTKAYGVLFAMGGFAVGGIAMGGMSIGLISLGGIGVGLLAIAGLAIGGLAMGGASAGFVAIGGVAIGWLGAHGGLAIAHTFAIGGEAVGMHANNVEAESFFKQLSALDFRQASTRNFAVPLIWLPVLLAGIPFLVWKRRKSKRS
ncbi:MAG: RNA polymerase sigma factor [Limisphaerales bacterium]